MNPDRVEIDIGIALIVSASVLASCRSQYAYDTNGLLLNFPMCLFLEVY